MKESSLFSCILSILLLTVVFIILPSFSALVVHCAGNGTQTLEETISSSSSLSESPTPDLSASLSQSVSESVHTESGTFSHDPGICSAEYSVFPLNFETMPYSDIVGYPEDKVGDVFHYNSIESVKIGEGGFSVAIRLENGYFFPNVDMDIAFKIFGKSQLIEAALVPAEQTVGIEDDFVSREGHGINDFWPSAASSLFQFRRSNNAFSLQVLPLPGYRLSADEWIIINFYFNATAPLGCATKTAVIRATSHRAPWYVAVIGGIALFIMVAGIISATSQNTIPTSHHAGMVAIIAAMHFAQEDGQPLSLAVSPFQLSFGSTKYRYVLGALYSNAGVIALIFLGQRFAMWYVARRKGYDKAQAATAVLYPRLLSTIVMHLAPAVFGATARSFGNQTSESFIVTSALLVFSGYVLVTSHRVNVSSTMSFQAEFIENDVQSAHPLLNLQNKNNNKSSSTSYHYGENGEVIAVDETDGAGGGGDINDTFLQTWRSRLTLQKKGYWRSTDPADSFVKRFGMVFESLYPRVKHFMLIESIDIAITALLTVFDNYTPFLAFYQFGLTLLLKLAMLLYLIWKRPLLAPQSSFAMLANYGGQVVACLALAIGALRYEIRQSAQVVQGLGCGIAICGLLYDVFVHITTSAFQFYDLYKRNKEFDEADETLERRLELADGFRRAKTAEECEQIERGEKLKFWYEHFCLKAREAKIIAEEDQRNTEEYLVGGGGDSKDKSATTATSKKLQQKDDTNNNNNMKKSNKNFPDDSNPNASITSVELEQDRDWIFGRAYERRQELPHYQLFPLWQTLTFSEQTDFFRHLFRGDLEPAIRHELEEAIRLDLEEQRKIEMARQAEAEDMEERMGSSGNYSGEYSKNNNNATAVGGEDLEALDAAVTSSIKNSYFTESLGGVSIPLLQNNNNNNDSLTSNPTTSKSAGAAAASSSSTNTTHQTFSNHYDSDGIFIDRYHPLYKQRKAERKKQKILLQQKREQEFAAQQQQQQNQQGSGRNSPGQSTHDEILNLSQQQKLAAAEGMKEPKKPKTKEETFKEAAAKFAKEREKDPSLSIANQVRKKQQQMNLLSDGGKSTFRGIGEAFPRTANALSREWTKISERTSKPKPVPFLTEDDYVAL